MAKKAIARKSTHTKGKAARKLRTNGKPTEDNIDPNMEYEVKSVGPIYVAWSKKRSRTPRGKVVKKYQMKKSNDHFIWVEWKDPFSDQGFWSAEPQEVFGPKNGLVADALKDKFVWPWPSKNDGISGNFEDRVAELKKDGFKMWKDPEKKNKWELSNPLLFTTSASESDESSGPDDKGSSTETPDDNDDEEEDEV